jgi:hypothetical protein
MAGNFRPAEDVSDYSSDDDGLDDHGWLGLVAAINDDECSSYDEPPHDGLLIDEWVQEAEEDGWTTVSTGLFKIDFIYYAVQYLDFGIEISYLHTYCTYSLQL